MADSFGKLARQINQAVKIGSIRALNKAISATKTQVVKALVEDTGLTSPAVKKRIVSHKATVKNPTASVSIAINKQVSLAEFKPKVQKVLVRSNASTTGKRGRPRNRTFYGVTVDIGGHGRELVPGGFLRTGKGSGKELVYARQSTIDVESGDYTNQPSVKGEALISLTTPILKESAQGRQEEFKQYLGDKFDALSDASIDFALSEAIAGTVVVDV